MYSLPWKLRTLFAFDMLTKLVLGQDYENYKNLQLAALLSFESYISLSEGAMRLWSREKSNAHYIRFRPGSLFIGAKIYFLKEN